MATHIIKAEVKIPNLAAYPDELLGIQDFQVEVSLNYMGNPIVCSTLDEAAALVKRIYAEELEKRNRKT